MRHFVKGENRTAGIPRDWFDSIFGGSHRFEQAPHDEGLVKGSHHGDIERSPVASVSKVQAHLRDAARFRARSTSHAVAAHSSCTKIPLSAGRAQGRREPFSKAAFQAMACYGSSTWIRQD